MHRKGKLDHYSFLAGVYSLVEKGLATVHLQKTSTRLLKDSEAPHAMLAFTLSTTTNRLSQTEQLLVSWLFQRKGSNGQLSFSMNNLAGVTKREKNNQQQLTKYHRQFRLFKEKEKEWF